MKVQYPFQTWSLGPVLTYALQGRVLHGLCLKGGRFPINFQDNQTLTTISIIYLSLLHSLILAPSASPLDFCCRPPCWVSIPESHVLDCLQIEGNPCPSPDQPNSQLFPGLSNAHIVLLTTHSDFQWLKLWYQQNPTVSTHTPSWERTLKGHTPSPYSGSLVTIEI